MTTVTSAEDVAVKEPRGLSKPERKLKPVTDSGIYRSPLSPAAPRQPSLGSTNRTEPHPGRRSHGAAVLDARLGGQVGPGQQRAKQGLGLAVQPLGEGAGAQAGQGGADVLDVVSGGGG